MQSYSHITPAGWLADYLHTQMNGLTGHMAAAGFPFDRKFWGNPSVEEGDYSGIFWWPYEQTAYHIDGFVRAAILLRDEKLLARAQEMIYDVILHPDEDGYLGPKQLKVYADDTTRWAHVVFFRACLALYDDNHDERILRALERHYLNVPFDYSEMRNVLNTEIMLAVYARGKNEQLLALAEKAYAEHNRDADQILEAASHGTMIVGDNNNLVCNATLTNGKKLAVHGVSYNEYAKLGALFFAATGKKEYLDVTIRAYEKIKRFYLLPGGCNSSTERMRNNHYDECNETCDAADLSWSLENLFAITDETSYADMIEKCVFNAGIGCVTEDFRALQYFSCGNQLVLNDHSSHTMFQRGNKGMRFSPAPMTACCPGNLNRIVPNYILHMWSLSGDVVSARLLGPSSFTGEIDGKKFEITERTSYPFDLSVCFTVRTEGALTLRIRIPAWCRSLKLTGASYVREGGYAVVRVEGNTEISAAFEAEIEKKKCGPGVYFMRGPLVYSLGMKGNREITKKVTVDGIDFPTYAMSPDAKWNYAFCEDATPRYIPGSATRFDLAEDLPKIAIEAREITNFKIHTVHKWRRNNWKYETIVVTDTPLTTTPSLPRRDRAKLADAREEIFLYPYAACKLRTTVLLSLS